MIVVHDILKADPYRCFEDDQFYIPKKVFFNHVYVKPSQSIIKKLKKECQTEIVELNSFI